VKCSAKSMISGIILTGVRGDVVKNNVLLLKIAIIVLPSLA